MADSAVYGHNVLEVEPYGSEYIPLAERHGNPWSLATLWFSANMNPATWLLGGLAVTLFGFNLAQAEWIILIGNLIGALPVAVMSLYGPKLGVPQLVQSRAAFGFFGNFGPALLNVISCVGWYAVNSIPGVFAVVLLLHVSFLPGLVILVLIQVLLGVFGHNMIHWFEKVSAYYL